MNRALRYYFRFVQTLIIGMSFVISAMIPSYAANSKNNLKHHLYSTCLAPNSMAIYDRYVLGAEFIKIVDALNNIGIYDSLNGSDINNQTINQFLLEKPELLYLIFNRFVTKFQKEIAVQIRNYYSSRGIKEVRKLLNNYAKNYLLPEQAKQILSLINKKTKSGKYSITLKHLKFANKLYLRDLYIRKNINKQISNNQLPKEGSVEEKYSKFLRSNIAKAYSTIAGQRRFDNINELLEVRLWDLPVFAVNNQGNISIHAMRWVIEKDSSSYKFWKEQFLGYGKFQRNLQSLADLTGLKDPPNFDKSNNTKQVTRSIPKTHIVKEKNDTKDKTFSWVLFRGNKKMRYASLYDLWRSIFHELNELLNDLSFMRKSSDEIKKIYQSLTLDGNQQGLLFPDLGNLKIKEVKGNISNLKKEFGSSINPNWSVEKREFFEEILKFEMYLTGAQKIKFEVLENYFVGLQKPLESRIKNILNIIDKIKKGRLSELFQKIKERNYQLLLEIEDITEQSRLLASNKNYLQVKNKKAYITGKIFKLVTDPNLKKEPEFFRIHNLLFQLKQNITKGSFNSESSNKVLKKLNKLIKYSNLLYTILNQTQSRIIKNKIEKRPNININLVLQELYIENLKSLKLLSAKHRFERIRGWIKLKYAISPSMNKNLLKAHQFLIWILDIREGADFPLNQIGKQKRPQIYNYLSLLKTSSSRLEDVDLVDLIEKLVSDYKLSHDDERYLQELLWDDSLLESDNNILLSQNKFNIAA